MTGTVMVPAAAQDYLVSRGYDVRHVARDAFTSSELHDALAGVEGYMIGGYEEPLAEHFEQATALRAVGWVGTDYKAYVPGWERAFELGIAFLNAPGANAASVAEFACLLMLSMSRPFTARVIAPGSEPANLSAPGSDLLGKQLGIIGLGRIGAHLARIAGLGLGMKVVYTSPRRQLALEEALGVEYVAKNVLLESSDVVSLHRPGPGLGDPVELGASDFDQLRGGAIVVNTAHHRLVDPDALADAIELRDVRAGMDGVGTEKGWSRLIALGPERFLAVPSMAFNTSDANRRASMRIATGLCDVLDGGISEDLNNPGFQEIRAARHASEGR